MKKILPLCLAALMTAQVQAQANKTSTLESLEQGQGQQAQQAAPQQNQTATLKSAARLFGTKDDLTTVITIIPSGSTVSILGSDSTYYRVSYGEDEGYIFKRQAEIDKTPKPVSNNDNNSGSMDQQNQNEAQPRDNNQEVQNQRSRFSYLEDKYGTSMAARINSGKIWKGMTPEMVKDSWGSPQKINRVINGNTMKEEWTYKNTVLYFRDNTLVEWGPARK